METNHRVLGCNASRLVVVLIFLNNIREFHYLQKCLYIHLLLFVCHLYLHDFPVIDNVDIIGLKFPVKH